MPITGGKRHGLRVLAILSALMAFASISTDFYLPALPAMTAALRSDAGTMEFTISGYLIGFSLGQLFWDPLARMVAAKFADGAPLSRRRALLPADLTAASARARSWGSSMAAASA